MQITDTVLIRNPKSMKGFIYSIKIFKNQAKNNQKKFIDKIITHTHERNLNVISNLIRYKISRITIYWILNIEI